MDDDSDLDTSTADWAIDHPGAARVAQGGTAVGTGLNAPKVLAQGTVPVLVYRKAG